MFFKDFKHGYLNIYLWNNYFQVYILQNPDHWLFLNLPPWPKVLLALCTKGVQLLCKNFMHEDKNCSPFWKVNILQKSFFPHVIYNKYHISFVWDHISEVCICCFREVFCNISVIFFDSTKFKIVWIKITTFFKRRVSIILWSFSS